ncbi:hypothetical protein ABIE67_005224 [Streptomyces sp. V4I8]|uniref:hypothetical protein n=1 Tax=Streptomyces sp. V4I8 TaxID=3156469 RepID=UPI00351667DD
MAVADPLDTLPFKTLVAQVGAVLLTHGVEVEATSVRGVAAHLVEVMAQRIGMDQEEAVHLVTPEAVAEIIVKAAREEDQGVSSPHAMWPVRIEDRTVSAPVVSIGHLVMAASQAGKYAGLNDDGAAAAHLLDLATEIGAALVENHADGAQRSPWACWTNGLSWSTPWLTKSRRADGASVPVAMTMVSTRWMPGRSRLCAITLHWPAISVNRLTDREFA